MKKTIKIIVTALLIFLGKDRQISSRARFQAKDLIKLIT